MIDYTELWRIKHQLALMTETCPICEEPREKSFIVCRFCLDHSDNWIMEKLAERVASLREELRNKID